MPRKQTNICSIRFQSLPSQLYALLFKELILLRQNLIAQSFHSIFIFGEVKVSLRWWSTFANYAVDRSIRKKQGHSYYSEGRKAKNKARLLLLGSHSEQTGITPLRPLFFFLEYN